MRESLLFQVLSLCTSIRLMACSHAPLPPSPSKVLSIKDEETISEAEKLAWLERSANLPDLTTNEHLDIFTQ